MPIKSSNIILSIVKNPAKSKSATGFFAHKKSRLRMTNMKIGSQAMYALNYEVISTNLVIISA